jgi:hypothetical protein
LLGLLTLPGSSFAQTNSGEPTEVYLSFQYRGVVGVYITAYYKNDEFYLPVNEIFNALMIQQDVDKGALRISGNFLGDIPYYFNFQRPTPNAKAGDTNLELRASDFLIKETGYFVRPAVLESLFGLNFTVNFSNLTLSLETTDELPVYAQYQREQKRKKLDRNQLQYSQNYYPLAYDRSYAALDGAFLDYNVSAIYSGETQFLTTSNAIGAEILGGDVQGNFFGAISDEQQSFTTNNLRWRYVQRNNPYFSTAIAGQTSSKGIGNRSITGIKLSNKPVQPRKLFDRYVIDGQTTPESEVELYLNNRLVDYQQADIGGNYRFVVPLTYGSTEYSVRIFTPSGRSVERNTRIQIPFEYLPAGAVDYTASFGKLDNPVLGTSEEGYQAEATVSTGLTNWLTGQFATEYLTEFHSGAPSFTATLNSRLLSRYLISVSANSENFYQLMSSVVYSSGASWNLSYDYNPGDSRLYNIGGNEHQARLSLFTPFSVGSLPFNIRLLTNFQKNGPAEFVRYRTDLSTRLGRLNVRMGYQDQQITPLSLQTTPSSLLTNSYTYTIGRTPDTPGLFREMFIRGQLSYSPGLKQMEEIEFQLSKDLDRTRARLTLGHNFQAEFNTISLNFTVDFNSLRTSTTARSARSQYTVNQNFRGSISYDPNENQVLLDNRQQTGQSGAAVRLFVDNNNDGSYQESIDDPINDPAVRIDRAGGKVEVKNGINYIKQLLPYYRYNIEINKSALKNPLLVPEVGKFSFITDPNQYKPIEIPFYLSGVISGRVDQLQQDSTLRALSGARLYLESNFDKENSREPISKELRTFSDGSFYTYEIPPGKYNLFVDPNQLDFLEAIAKPDTMQIEIEALSQGDFKQGLQFTLISKPDTVASEQPITTINKTDKDTTALSVNEKEASYYQIQIGSFKTRSKSQKVAQTVTAKTKSPFSLIYSSKNKLFGIRGPNIDDRKLAIETAYSYSQNNYPRAALVILTKDSTFKSNAIPKITDDTDFRFQLYVAKHSKLHTGRVATLIQEYPGLRLNQTGEKMLIIDNIQRWKHLENLKNELSQIPSVQKVIRVIVQDK